MRFTRRLLVVGGVVAMSLTLGGGAASASGAVPGCGQGLVLVESPFLEGLVAAVTQGNVNGDGFVCIQFAPAEKGGQEFVIVIDNRVRR